MRECNNYQVRVMDMDPVSVEICQAKGVEASTGNALEPQVAGDEDIICFNLILHHLIGSSEAITTALQRKALAAWCGQAKALFIHEYIYDSFFFDLSGKLIYLITKSKLLSSFASLVAKFIPAFKANTFGVGVRFRSHTGWVEFFKNSGYEVKSCIEGGEENISAPLRLLLIKSIRRNSYLLTPVL